MRAARPHGLLLAGATLMAGCTAILNFDPYLDAAREDAGEPRVDAGPPPSDGSRDAGSLPPPPPQLRFPWNGYMTGSSLANFGKGNDRPLRPRFIWEEAEGATRYEIQIDLACDRVDFRSCTFEGVTPIPVSETVYEPTEALALSSPGRGERFYWRARSCDEGAGCGAYSEVRYLDVGLQPGDFNNDGQAEVAIGNPTWDHGGVETGIVYVYDGAMLDPGPPVVDATPKSLVQPGGFTPGTHFGESMAAVGDVSGDGVSDLLVGGPGRRQAYLFLGQANVDLLDMIPITLNQPETSMPEADFGTTVAGVGDLDGDGRAEVAVSAPGWSPSWSSGRVYLYFDPTSPVEAPILLPTPSVGDGARFGLVMSGGGDIDGDGLADLVVGVPDAASRAGRVYVFRGQRDRALMATTPAWLVLATSESSASQLGSSVAVADLNGDGFADIVAGMRDYIPPRGVLNGTGGFTVFFGGREVTASTIPRIFVANPDMEVASFFGATAVALPDRDGEGRGERGWLAVAAPRHSEREPEPPGEGLTQIGRVYGYEHGSPAEPAEPPTLTARPSILSPNAAEFGSFGHAIGVIGDVDGDGYAELFVGAPGEPTFTGTIEHRSSGRAYIYRGGATDGSPSWFIDPPNPRTDERFGAAVAGEWSCSVEH